MNTYLQEKKRRYKTPELFVVQLEPARLMTGSARETLMVGGTDTEAEKGANGHVWADVKANTVDWDE